MPKPLQNNVYGLERIFTIRQLSLAINVPEAVIVQFANEAVEHYHPFKKEKPGKKPRKIANPDKPLKAIQRRIARNILKNVLFPPEMFGAIKGRSLKDNASVHVRQKILVTLDIKDCFPSVSYSTIFRLFRERFGYSREVSSVMTKLTTFRGALPQGAPTSSALLNIYLIPLCQKLKLYFEPRGCKLSFWVDDIGFSGKDAFLHIQFVARELQKMGFSLSRGKIKIMRKGYHQEIAGLGVNDIVSVPKEKIKKYGNELDLYNEKSVQTFMARLTYIENINPKQRTRLERRLL